MADNQIILTPGNSPAPSPIATVPAETPGNSPLENESDTSSIPAAQVGLFQSIRQAGGAVLDSVGIGRKRGRGRPPIHGKYSKANGSDGKNPVELAAAGAGGYEAELPGDDEPLENEIPRNNPPAVDSSVGDFFRKVCASSVKSVLGIAKEVVRWRAKAARVDERFTDKALTKCEPDPEALAEFTEALDRVLKKRNIQPQNAEEWALAISGARLLAPYALLLKEFQAEINRNRPQVPKPEAIKTP